MHSTENHRVNTRTAVWLSPLSSDAKDSHVEKERDRAHRLTVKDRLSISSQPVVSLAGLSRFTVSDRVAVAFFLSLSSSHNFRGYDLEDF